MKIAAARALAELAREPVPEEVAAAYGNSNMEFGPEYIIPSPFDPRLIQAVPVAVAQAAADTGVAKRPIEDIEAYKAELAGRLNPTANTLSLIYKQLRAHPKTVVFSEGEEENVVRAATQWRDNGYGRAILVGRDKQVKVHLDKLGVKDTAGLEIINAATTEKNEKYIDFMYDKLQRKGFLHRDCVRQVKNDRNVFAACMLGSGDADAMITGLTRSYNKSLRSVLNIIDPREHERVAGVSMVISRNKKTVFMGDTSVSPAPSPEELAKIAIQTADFAKKMGHTPRVAMLAFSNFGNPTHQNTETMRKAVEILDGMDVDFEYDGEMTPDVALNEDIMKLYPFCRLSGPANVLIMPSLNASNISGKLLQELGGGTIIGPILLGLEKSAQIAPMNSSVSDILNIAALGAVEFGDN